MRLNNFSSLIEEYAMKNTPVALTKKPRNHHKNSNLIERGIIEQKTKSKPKIKFSSIKDLKKILKDQKKRERHSQSLANFSFLNVPHQVHNRTSIELLDMINGPRANTIILNRSNNDTNSSKNFSLIEDENQKERHNNYSLNKSRSRKRRSTSNPISTHKSFNKPINYDRHHLEIKRQSPILNPHYINPSYNQHRTKTDYHSSTKSSSQIDIIADYLQKEKRKLEKEISKKNRALKKYKRKIQRKDLQLNKTKYELEKIKDMKKFESSGIKLKPLLPPIKEDILSETSLSLHQSLNSKKKEGVKGKFKIPKEKFQKKISRFDFESLMKAKKKNTERRWKKLRLFTLGLRAILSYYRQLRSFLKTRRENIKYNLTRYFDENLSKFSDNLYEILFISLHKIWKIDQDVNIIFDNRIRMEYLQSKNREFRINLPFIWEDKIILIHVKKNVNFLN